MNHSFKRGDKALWLSLLKMGISSRYRMGNHHNMLWYILKELETVAVWGEK